MLLLINEEKNSCQTFHDYPALHNTIEAHEKQRNARKTNRRKGHPWVFASHCGQRMATYQGIFTPRAANSNGASGQEASGWDILEIVSGDIRKPVFIPLAHDLDWEALQKNWCHRYCHAHRLTLIEITDVTVFRKLVPRFGS